MREINGVKLKRRPESVYLLLFLKMLESEMNDVMNHMIGISFVMDKNCGKNDSLACTHSRQYVNVLKQNYDAVGANFLQYPIYF